MPYLKTIFWIGLFFLFFYYLGYSVLFLFNLIKKIVAKQGNKFFTGVAGIRYFGKNMTGKQFNKMQGVDVPYRK